jgi:uncharacterized protein
MGARTALFLAAVAFLAVPLSAQESLPPSYLEFLKTLDHLQTLTERDLRDLASRAQAGAADAQYELALVYKCCGVVPQDAAAAQRWMQRAAEQGYVPAEAGMGEMYSDRHITGPAPNYADADRWLRLAATQGDAEAQFCLGVGYGRGYFGGVDYEESLKWLRKAADQGLPNAQFSLGQMYEEGEGVAQNDEIAAQWYREAADHYSDIQPVFNAEVQLMCLYRDGGLKRNDVEAYMWAAVLGSRFDPPIDDDVKQFARRMLPI